MGYRWSFRKVNWEEYRREIEVVLRNGNLDADLNIQGRYNAIVKVIRDA